MTNAQEDALKKAFDLLTEQFEHVLLAVHFEVQEGTDRSFKVYWHGGSLTALGMACRAMEHLKDKPNEQEPEDEV